MQRQIVAVKIRLTSQDRMKIQRQPRSFILDRGSLNVVLLANREPFFWAQGLSIGVQLIRVFSALQRRG